MLTGARESMEDSAVAKCAICLQAMTGTGEHRIASLKCGHLYGHSCIESWIDRTSRATCPKCRVSTRRSDVRILRFDSDPVVPGEEPQSTEEVVATPSVPEGPEVLETELVEAGEEIGLADAECTRAQTLLTGERSDLTCCRIALNGARVGLNKERAMLNRAIAMLDVPRTDMIAARERLNASIVNQNNVLRELIAAQSMSDGSHEAKTTIDILWTRCDEAERRVDEERDRASREADIVLEARARVNICRVDAYKARSKLMDACQSVIRRRE